jgi:predicted lysophospholipase L1 biosynthesis ABC-type transport system permease subunit
MTSFLGDLRYAFRTFAKAPGFTAVVVATLALGIGANTAIFTVVRGVLLKSLPYRDPDRLVRIFSRRSALSRRPAARAGAARAAIRSLEPDRAISDIEPLPRAVSETVARPRFYAWMLGIFAALALLLAGSGLYGVTSYGIEQRTREIGVRMALGADRRDVLRLVVGEAVRTCAVGVVLGLAASAAAGRLLGSLLFSVQPIDPAVLAADALFLLIASVLASSAPAVRASRLDPMVALRAE